MNYSFSHQLQLRIRYSETDQMGCCYYGNYPAFLELGRVESLRSLGISYRDLEHHGILLPVLNLSIEYKRPLYYDDIFTVETSLISIEGSKVFFTYSLFNEQGDLTTLASTVLVFTNSGSFRPTRAPESLLLAIKAYEIKE